MSKPKARMPALKNGARKSKETGKSAKETSENGVASTTGLATAVNGNGVLGLAKSVH